VGRARDGREPWHPEQAIDVRAALAASTGGAGHEVRVGLRADLAVIERDPYAASVDDLRAMPVAATLVDGRITHATR
jgi:predicted amidohydrolase YtcJ